MAHVNIFIVGIFLGLLVGLAVAFMVLGNGININVTGIPDDYTIRGGVNLTPETGGQLAPGRPFP